MADVFISYARSTARQAQAAAKALRALGYSVWMDDELPAHRTFTGVIQEQLDAAKAAFVIWSADAVASEWVLSEANRAREQHKLVQASVDNSRLPMPFDQLQYADLSGWSGAGRHRAWLRVAASIADLVKPDGAVAKAAEPPTPFWRRLRVAPSLWSRPGSVAAALVLVAALAGGGLWLAKQRADAGRFTADTPFAVQSFRAATPDEAATAFAAVADSDVTGALTQGGVRTISASGGGGPRFVMDGVVDGFGSRVHASVRLTDLRSQTTIWTADFAAPADDSARLRVEVAARAVSVAQITK